MVFALGLHQQARIGVGADELRVAAVRHRGDRALRGHPGLVLLLELGDILLVQVGPARGLRAGGDERKGDGGGEAVDAALIHWRYPWNG